MIRHAKRSVLQIPDETLKLLDEIYKPDHCTPVNKQDKHSADPRHKISSKIGRPVSDRIRKIFTPSTSGNTNSNINIKTISRTLRGPWAIIPVPEPPRNTDDYLYRLTVKSDRSWHINVTDLTTGDIRNYSSGTGCAVSMDGQVMTGRELSGL